jgi:hypothetical protein
LESYAIIYINEVLFVPGKGWNLIISEETAVPRMARLYVKNLSESDYKIDILGEDDKKKYDASRDLESGSTDANPQGKYLTVSNTKDATVYPGMVARITKKNKVAVYSGAIGKYKSAKYDVFERKWRIYAEE